jgi:BA14K-like protein
VPTRPLTRWTAVIAAVGLIATAIAPATAAPVPSSTAALKSMVSSPISQVRWRGHHHGGGGGVAAGIIGGMLLGGIIASQANRYYDGPAYYGPPGYYGPRDDAWLNYCFSRYRSFDPGSGTYMGYDGRRHYCR